jgi:hypothetical protein
MCGESGIGKTSLIQQFVAEQGNAARTLWGGCAALFAPQPLAPLYDIARQVGGNLAASLAAADLTPAYRTGYGVAAAAYI